MAALVVVAHGSQLQPGSAQPARDLVHRLRSSGRFSRVRLGFWKQSPAFSEVLDGIEEETVYILPFFLADGYFARRVVPRELGLDRPDPRGRTRILCAPLGTVAALDSAVEKLGLEGAQRLQVPPTEASLVLVGHGTKRTRKSSQWVRDVAVRLGRSGRWGEVEAMFTDDAPHVQEALSQTACETLVVVPLMTAEGYHTRETIPADLGLGQTREGLVKGRRIAMTRALGTVPGMVALALESLRAAGGGVLPEPVAPQVLRGMETFAKEVQKRGEFCMGQVWVGRCAKGWRLCHKDDRGVDVALLVDLPDVRAVEDWVQKDSEGAFRPLATAPSLRSGWYRVCETVRDLDLVLDAIYPGAAALIGRFWQGESVLCVPWEQAVEHQSGLLSDLKNWESLLIQKLVTIVCEGNECIASCEWFSPGGARSELPRGSSPWCTKPCSMLLTFGASLGRQGEESTRGVVRLGEVNAARHTWRRKWFS